MSGANAGIKAVQAKLDKAEKQLRSAKTRAANQRRAAKKNLGDHIFDAGVAGVTAYGTGSALAQIEFDYGESAMGKAQLGLFALGFAAPALMGLDDNLTRICQGVGQASVGNYGYQSHKKRLIERRRAEEERQTQAHNAAMREQFAPSAEQRREIAEVHDQEEYDRQVAERTETVTVPVSAASGARREVA